MGLSAAWQAATSGSGLITNAKECVNDSYLKEACKYAAKGNEIARWDSDQISEFLQAFEGVKTFGVFGSLYRKRTEWRAWIDSLEVRERTCDCGCTNFYFFSELQWIQKDLIPSGPLRSIPPPDLQCRFDL